MTHELFPRSHSLRSGLAAGALMFLLIALALPAAALETRTFTETFPAGAEPVRLANLAGAVKLVPGTGGEVTVTATVHAEGGSDGETARLLDGMGWVKTGDVLGEPGWALSYPVTDYQGFHYPRGGESSGLVSWLGSLGSTRVSYLGEKVEIRGRRSSSAPTLWVDLEVEMPPGTGLALSNSVGGVSAGDLSGDLTLDTGSGDVAVASFSGELLVDTGSGDVEVGRLEGQGDIDTGSGDVEVRDTEASRLRIDTGSGDVEVAGGRVERLEADTGSGEIRIDGVEVVELVADTGSGDVEISGSLASARRIAVDTGSGDVLIYGGPDASFDLSADLGNGEVVVRYGDAELIRDGREVVGARRGDGRTRIQVDTGSGDCTLAPGR